MKSEEVKIMEEEWDYLILLDACRVDYFKEENRIPGPLEVRYSVGTATGKWRKKTFTEDYYDIIYVSGNPMVSKFKLLQEHDKVPFFKLDEVWDYGWDPIFKAVFPQEVTRATLRNVKEYPEKRMLIHYLQPHPPFLRGPVGPIGRGMELEYLVGKKERDLTYNEGVALKANIYNLLGEGKVSGEEVREGYRRNLRMVLEEVEELLKKLPEEKKVIITSDHNEFLGYEDETPVSWGHSGKFKDYPDARKVPWFKVKMDEVLR